MMTQSVMTQAPNLAVSTKAITPAKQKQTGNDFDLLMGNSMKSVQSASVNANTVKKTSSQASTKQDNTKNDYSVSKAVQSGSDQKDNTTRNVTGKLGNQKVSNQSDNSKISNDESAQSDQKDENPVNDQMTAQLMQMLQSVVQTVMDKLNLTSDQFDQMLTSQGMSAVDLLQPENLQQFILASNGEDDITAALTNENLADMINDLINSVDDIKSESNTGLTDEQMQAILKQALKESQKDADANTFVSDKIVSGEEPAKQSIASNEIKKVETQSDNTSAGTSAQLSEANDTSVTSAIGTDTQSGSNQEDSNNQDLNKTDMFQNFVDNLAKASQNVQADFSEGMDQVTKIRDIANQIIDSIKLSVSADHSSMELQLNPESLGKVNLSVQSKDGILTAHFVVQNEISKEAIESQMQTLRETFNQQGLKVEAIDVTVASYAFDQNNNQASDNQQETKQSNSGRKISLDDAISMSEEPEAEESLENASDIRGSLVDYTA